MPKIDIAAAPTIATTGYPGALAAAVQGRSKKRLGDAGGVSQFGVNLTRLAPGATSSHRHWHRAEDEFVFVLEGEATLVEDDGETPLRAGEAAAFPAGAPLGHHLVNRGARDVVYLEIGSRVDADVVTYTDPAVDLRAEKEPGGPWRYVRRDGSAF